MGCLGRLPEPAEFCDRDAVYVIAGGLCSHRPDLVQSSAEFRQIVEQMWR